MYHRKDRDGFRFVDAEVRLVNNELVLPTVPYLANVLTGDSRGVELVLERRSVNGLNGWLSYAWNKSTLSDSAESFPSDYDQRHTVNAYSCIAGPAEPASRRGCDMDRTFPLPATSMKCPTATR